MGSAALLGGFAIAFIYETFSHNGRAPEVATGDLRCTEITWLSPQMGAEVGWETTVALKSSVRTHPTTVLVRPCSGETYYVQPNSHPLLPGAVESFTVTLGNTPDKDVASEFEIVGVCDDAFRPPKWSLDSSEVPHSAVFGKVTVRKVAGEIVLVAGETEGKDSVRVEGRIWTSRGGALLVKEGRKFTVIRTFRGSSEGNRFEEEVTRGDIYLAVCREGAPALRVGQSSDEIIRESYWLYPARKEPIEITSPRNGDEVSMNVVVEGLIHVDDLGDRYPAIAVHPVQTELIWIQPRPMTVEKIDGEYRFRCRAYCGTAREGIGEDFELYALLPKRGSLKEGDRLDRLPEGVPVSLSVLVTRAR